jgi:hypothetical protein
VKECIHSLVDEGEDLLISEVPIFGKPLFDPSSIADSYQLVEVAMLGSLH